MPLYMNESPRHPGPSLDMTDAEAGAREQLAACYRVFDLLGWTEMIFNHVTLRVPGPRRVFLINPFGLHYREVCASNLVAVDVNGEPVRPGQPPVNRAGFVTHAAIHGAIDDAHCVMHTHTTSGCAVASLEAGLSHDTFYGAQLVDRVAYHEFEGVTVDPDERERLLHDLGTKPLLILRNHGLLSWAATLPQAFLWLWTLQRACDVQIAASAAGPLRPVSAAARAQARTEAGPVELAVCRLVWESLLRRVETESPGHRD